MLTPNTEASSELAAVDGQGAKKGIEKFTFHDLRAKSASDSESLQETSARLGHTSPAITDRVYMRVPYPGIRVVLGHFLFVYIHAYMDGNGRKGRFLMNIMLAAGGYPWTVIPVQRRVRYMQSLEAASVGQDIRPFTEFLGGLVRDNLAGKPLPGVPGG